MPNSSIVSGIILLLLVCLVSTIILELLFALVFRVKKHNLLIVVLAQIVTNSIVVLASNYVYYSTGTMEGYYISLAVLEVLIVIVEGLMYKFFFKDYTFLNPFALSLILNILSFSIGEIAYSFVG